MHLEQKTRNSWTRLWWPRVIWILMHRTRVRRLDPKSNWIKEEKAVCELRRNPEWAKLLQIEIMSPWPGGHPGLLLRYCGLFGQHGFHLRDSDNSQRRRIGMFVFTFTPWRKGGKSKERKKEQNQLVGKDKKFQHEEETTNPRGHGCVRR